MQQIFVDIMTIVCHFGKPVLFITFIANLHWLKITFELFLNQYPTDQYYL